MSLVLHQHPLSGHCHRVEALLAILDVPYEKRFVDLTKGEHKTPAFLAKNPLGQLPVLEDGTFVLTESTAMLRYLVRRHADGSAWYPRDPARAAEVDRWLAIATGPLVNGPARARVLALFQRPDDPEPARALARDLFQKVDRHLEGRTWLAGDEASIADLAFWAYVAHAPEGGVSLAPYPALRRWVAAVRALPRFVPMVETATKERATAS